jgi:HPt (histidine-containing phosphotransfer) domain-containing protein
MKFLSASMEIWDLLQSVVSLFEEDHPKQLERIRQAIGAGDAAGLMSAAHSLKGSLLALAADRAAAVALELEKMGRDSRIEGAAQVLVSLESEVLGPFQRIAENPERTR